MTKNDNCQENCSRGIWCAAELSGGGLALGLFSDHRIGSIDRRIERFAESRSMGRRERSRGLLEARELLEARGLLEAARHDIPFVVFLVCR